MATVMVMVIEIGEQQLEDMIMIMEDMEAIEATEDMAVIVDHKGMVEDQMVDVIVTIQVVMDAVLENRI